MVDKLETLADVLSMASGDSEYDVNDDVANAKCKECGKEFTYKIHYFPVRIPAMKSPYFRRDVCDACQDRLEQEQEAKERRDDFELVMMRYRRGDLGTRLADATFATFVEGEHNRRALATAKAWVTEADPPNLLIVGPVGSGKSFLAACIHNALLTSMRPAYWINAGSLMAQIRRGFSDRGAAADANEKIVSAGRAPVLVLDDLGKVHPGKDVSWVEETFYSIVEERYRNERATIVTTEWRSASLAERVGLSVVSRLEDGAWVAGIKKPETAYRKPAA